MVALDDDLPSPSYQQRFGTLGAAVVGGANNVLCAARLVDRPEAFRMRPAWGRQSLALSHALESYIDGLRGLRPHEAFERSQLIVLTRVIRAAAAIAVIDLRRGAIRLDHGA